MITHNAFLLREETSHLLLVLLVVVLALLSGCSSGPFTIEDERFQATDVCDGTGTIEISMKDGEVNAQAQDELQVMMLKDGMPSIWCHGLTHRFVGRVELNGYTFESDPSDPLIFKVDRDKGYYYLSGRGTVTDSDGKSTVLP